MVLVSVEMLLLKNLSLDLLMSTGILKLGEDPHH